MTSFKCIHQFELVFQVRGSEVTVFGEIEQTCGAGFKTRSHKLLSASLAVNDTHMGPEVSIEELKPSLRLALKRAISALYKEMR
jgi:hypothetical protein